MPKKLRWRRSPTGWDGKPCKNWRLSRNRIRCWPGTESSSPPSSTDRSFANPWVVPELTRKASGWQCGWRRKIPGWGYDRIVGAMANLGLRLSDQTVGNILRRHDIPPAPKRKQATTWRDFIRAHMAVLVTTDFFTVEVLTLKGLVTYYVLFFIQLESRRVCLAGITPHPDQQWMEQMARNVTMEDAGFLISRRYLLHDRDSKYCASFRQVIEAATVQTLALPPNRLRNAGFTSAVSKPPAGGLRLGMFSPMPSASIAASICLVTSGSAGAPSCVENLMPLYSGGLCEAVKLMAPEVFRVCTA